MTERLIHVLPEFTVEPTAIYAVVPDRKLMPNKVKVLIEYLQEHFKNFNK